MDLFDILFADPMDFNCDGTVTREEEEIYWAEEANRLQRIMDEDNGDSDDGSDFDSDFDSDSGFDSGFDSDFGSDF